MLKGGQIEDGTKKLEQVIEDMVKLYHYLHKQTPWIEDDIRAVGTLISNIVAVLDVVRPYYDGSRYTAQDHYDTFVRRLGSAIMGNEIRKTQSAIESPE